MSRSHIYKTVSLNIGFFVSKWVRIPRKVILKNILDSVSRDQIKAWVRVMAHLDFSNSSQEPQSYY